VSGNKIVFHIGVSIDGFFEGPNREIDWHCVDEELHQHMNDVLAPTGAFLQGRVTHQLMADHWPTADQDPGSGPAEVEFSRIWREMPKWVFSRTLESDPWATVKRDVVPEEVEQLKREVDGDIVVGGPDLAATFLRLGLVDVLRFYVHPVVLGQGHPAFLTPPRLDMELTASRAFGNGVVQMDYAIRR
jgi:dihydrofolate reductase